MVEQGVGQQQGVSRRDWIKAAVGAVAMAVGATDYIANSKPAEDKIKREHPVTTSQPASSDVTHANDIARSNLLDPQATSQQDINTARQTLQQNGDYEKSLGAQREALQGVTSREFVDVVLGVGGAVLVPGRVLRTIVPNPGVVYEWINPSSPQAK